MTGRRKQIVIGVTVALLVATSAACKSRDPVPTPAPAGTSLAGVTVEPDGDAKIVVVAPDQPLAVSVPGLGRLVAPSGAFSAAGKLVVQKVRSSSPEADFVVAGGPGVDVTMDGTSVVSPVTIIFDDPATTALLPEGAVPVVLHKPETGDWETIPASLTPDGYPYIVTTAFSPNLFGWIPIPDWVRGIGDSLADYFAQRTDPRPCNDNAPSWSSVRTSTTLVHLCKITNVGSSGTRAELQVQSNRRYFQWVSVPAGNDYLWVADQPDWFRKGVAALSGLGHDWRREVLLPGNGWFTAGYLQPDQNQTKTFNSQLDASSVAFSLGTALLGIKSSDAVSVAGIVTTVGKCLAEFSGGVSWDAAKKFIGCFIKSALEQLDNPDKALASAMSIFGEASYAKAAQEKLKGLATKLRWLGNALKVLGLVGFVQTIYWQLPDMWSAMGNDHPGQFTFTLAGKPVAPPATQAPPPTQGPPAPPAPTLTNFAANVLGPGSVQVSYNVGWQSGQDPVTCHFYIDGSEAFTAQCGTSSSKTFTGIAAGSHQFSARVSDKNGVWSAWSPTLTRDVPGSPPPAQPTVSVSRGTPCGGGGGSACAGGTCTSSSCGYVHVTTANFSGNVTCTFDSQQGNGGWLQNRTWGANESKDSPNWFGYHNNWVSVTCGGVTGTFTWP